MQTLLVIWLAAVTIALIVFFFIKVRGPQGLEGQPGPKGNKGDIGDFGSLSSEEIEKKLNEHLRAIAKNAFENNQVPITVKVTNEHRHYHNSGGGAISDMP